MTKKRTKIPERIAVQVLAANKHMCCICRKQGLDVILHHIDGDPSNNARANLCVLCTAHHAEVERKQGLGREYSPRELEIYKTDWEEHCKLAEDKGTITKNYFNLSNTVVVLKNNSIMEPFLRDIASGTTPTSVNASIHDLAQTVEDSTGGRVAAKDFAILIRKGTDWPDEGA